MIGRAERTADERVRERFLARHPKAKLYAGFGDFSFWRLEIDVGATSMAALPGRRT